MPRDGRWFAAYARARAMGEDAQRATDIADLDEFDRLLSETMRRNQELTRAKDPEAPYAGNAPDVGD